MPENRQKKIQQLATKKQQRIMAKINRKKREIQKARGKKMNIKI
jgi:hypothetical protein